MLWWNVIQLQQQIIFTNLVMELSLKDLPMCLISDLFLTLWILNTHLVMLPQRYMCFDSLLMMGFCIHDNCMYIDRVLHGQICIQGQEICFYRDHYVHKLKVHFAEAKIFFFLLHLKFCILNNLAIKKEAETTGAYDLHFLLRGLWAMRGWISILKHCSTVTFLFLGMKMNHSV